MAELAKRKARYEDLYQLPENMTGEIIDGKMIVTPRPSPKHALAATVLGARVTTPYYLADGGGPAAGSFFLHRKSNLAKIFSSRTWQAGRSNASRQRKRQTGFRLSPTGLARCFHVAPQESTRSSRCPFTAVAGFRMSGWWIH
jgi:hypothetical protein